MHINDFTNKIKNELDNFKQNMINLEQVNKNPEDWMKVYLEWTEWTTDMHDMCWKDIEI